jgi:hypothetical protein
MQTDTGQKVTMMSPRNPLFYVSSVLPPFNPPAPNPTPFNPPAPNPTPGLRPVLPVAPVMPFPAHAANHVAAAALRAL